MDVAKEPLLCGSWVKDPLAQPTAWEGLTKEHAKIHCENKNYDIQLCEMQVNDWEDERFCITAIPVRFPPFAHLLVRFGVWDG